MAPSAMIALTASMLPAAGLPPVEWVIGDVPVPYEVALAEMDRLSSAIAEGRRDERVWLVEHPPLYTAGTSARPQDLTDPERFPVFTTGRGGQYTYHGPGQRVAYVMVDVGRRFAHRASAAPLARSSRLARMKRSRSPSSTAWVLPVSTSVR